MSATPDPTSTPQTYEVSVTCEVTVTITVEATSEDDAREKARAEYDRGAFDADDPHDADWRNAEVEAKS